MTDYIIVGFGLSGASLAYRLQKAGKSFVIFDDDSQEASKVAGGLMNPVVLKRFTLAWNADLQMQQALSFYKELQSDLGVDFLKPLEIYRRFSSVEEQNDWFSASDKPGLDKYLDTKLVPDINPHIKGKFSFGRVFGTWRLETRKMLNAYTDYLYDRQYFVKEAFDHAALDITPDGVTYKGITAKNIIFCEGFGLRKNPFFNYLPLKGNKGEYIIVKVPDLDLKVAVKSSIFIFPAGEGLYAVGATYSNEDKTRQPTEEARQELVKKLKDLISADFEIVDQIAGLRPSTIDRRPLAGKHPLYDHVYCCNGFGSRGILLAPSISEELLLHIEEEKELPAEMDLKRFTRKWFPKN